MVASEVPIFQLIPTPAQSGHQSTPELFLYWPSPLSAILLLGSSSKYIWFQDLLPTPFPPATRDW